MWILPLLFVALSGLAVALMVRALALPRLRAAQRLDQIKAYGFSSGGAVAAPIPAPSGGGVVAGIAAWLGDRVAGRVGVVKEQALRRELVAAGMYRMPPRLLLGYRALATLLMPVLGWLVGAGISPVAAFLVAVYFGVVGWVLPLTFVRRRATRRRKEIERALPDLIDLLVVTVEAGLGFTASLQVAAGRLHGPLAAEIRLVLHEQEMGVAPQQSLEHMIERADSPAMRSFVRSIVQGESRGVPIGTVMRNLAEEMRKRRRSAAEEQAQKTPVKLLLPLVLLILPVLGIVLLGPAILGIQQTIH